jgi:hypothetical protein
MVKGPRTYGKDRGRSGKVVLSRSEQMLHKKKQTERRRSNTFPPRLHSSFGPEPSEDCTIVLFVAALQRESMPQDLCYQGQEQALIDLTTTGENNTILTACV